MRSGSIKVEGDLSGTPYENTKDPSGFIDGSNISISYNSTNRTMTLTGDLRYYRNGVMITTLTSPWTSAAHGTDNGSWYLYDSGTGMAWSQTTWALSHVQCAYAYYGTTNRFGLRETHGFMPWQSHKVTHDTTGLYRTTGGNLTQGTYNVAPVSPIDTDNRPQIGSVYVQDEDLLTAVQAVAGTGSYCLLYYNASSTPMFSLDQANIVSLTSSTASYNSAGTLTAVPSGSFSNVYTVVLPTTDDTESKKYSTLFVPGTSIYTNADLARNEDLRSLSLDGLGSLATESVITNQLTLRVDSTYTSIGTFRIESVQKVMSVRYSPVIPPSTGGVVTNPIELQTFNVAIANYTQSVNQLIWSTFVYAGTAGKINRATVFCTQGGSGNTRVGVYNSSHQLLAQSANVTSLIAGLNNFTFSSEVTLDTGSYYYLAIQSRANGAILLGYNATVNPNDPVLARLDTNNAADPSSGMTTPISVSQSQYRVWIRAYFV